jgi:hypothetical protein
MIHHGGKNDEENPFIQLWMKIMVGSSNETFFQKMTIEITVVAIVKR